MSAGFRQRTFGAPRRSNPYYEAAFLNRAPAAFPEGDELLAQSREDMRSGEPERMATALDRLALALRMDPALAPAIVDLVTRRQEPAALLVRGDALRILGRVLEAEAAYAGAAAALERGKERQV